jgi:mono/diheme cytochrome c family protein
MKRPGPTTTIRTAGLLMAALLGACGVVDDRDPLPDPAQTAVVTRSTGSPPKTPAAPAAVPAAAPAPAASPAPAAVTGDAVRGKQLFLAIPNSSNACADCHMSVTMLRRQPDGTPATYEATLRTAVQANLGTMGQFADKLGDAEFRDLAAYLAGPGT